VINTHTILNGRNETNNSSLLSLQFHFRHFLTEGDIQTNWQQKQILGLAKILILHRVNVPEENVMETIFKIKKLWMYQYKLKERPETLDILWSLNLKWVKEDILNDS
jgi:hypothetical protein